MKVNFDKYIALRRELHKNAELSGQERKTVRILSEFLKNNSDCEIYPMDGWFYAIKRGGERKIAFRADMDALPIPESEDCPYGSVNPGVSHRCGHDGHSAALAAFACECRCENTAYFIFQPAEETGEGARKCAGLLREEGIGEIYGFHNLPGFEKNRVLYKYGTFACASMGLELCFKGRNSHAAYPENGVNPAFAIAKILLALDGLRQGFTAMTLITVIGVDIGGDAYGTGAGDGVIRLTVRGELEVELETLKERIIALCREKSVDMEFSYKIHDPFPETRNHDRCVDKIKNLCEDSVELAYPMRWSEDFGYYLKEVTGAFFGIGSGRDCSQLHTGGYDFPDELIETAVATFQKLASSDH